MVSWWHPYAPPATAGALDDEFDGESGGVPNGWTEYDHSTTTTVDEDEAGLELIQATKASDALGGIYKADPTGDITVWTHVSLNGLAHPATDSVVAGIALFEDATSSTSDVRIYGIEPGLTHAATYATYSTWSAHDTRTASTDVNALNGVSDIFLRIRRTGTTYHFDISRNGNTWQRTYTTAALGFVPAQIGLVMSTNGAGITTNARFDFFRSTNSDVGLTGQSGGDRIIFEGPGVGSGGGGPGRPRRPPGGGPPNPPGGGSLLGPVLKKLRFPEKVI